MRATQQDSFELDEIPEALQDGIDSGTLVGSDKVYTIVGGGCTIDLQTGKWYTTDKFLEEMLA